MAPNTQQALRDRNPGGNARRALAVTPAAQFRGQQERPHGATMRTERETNFPLLSKKQEPQGHPEAGGFR